MSDPINDLWVNSTIRIENEQGKFGTGFLIQKNTKKILVTNKHVLHECRSKRESTNFVYLHINISEDEQIIGKRIQFNLHADEHKLWTEHPDVQVDVLGIDVSTIYECYPNMVVKPVDSTLICDRSYLQQYNIVSGRQIVVLGYPLTVQHTTNVPMRIPGSIVSQIGQNIRDKWKNPDTGETEDRIIRGFLIESNVAIGSSGSPVVLDTVINIFGGEQNTIGRPFPPFLLGILAEEKFTYIDTPGSGVQPSYSGLTVVFSAETIIDVINLFS
ncbi:Putative peptidase [Nitrosotalea sinensis]|uniref:Peptidase n=1 Tax=Nitrosotalea sinensis TaxID=1499975 RepID=A0A2H1EJA5_9ARCH|nr:trypsin-like peptidase domain-containing protein [Candidatus Nitrosotalea sinensis]SHO47637.1 Putative peptidase [Candidatus Nitrosotalea sinensis]